MKTINKAVARARVNALKAQRDKIAEQASEQLALLVEAHLIDLEQRFQRTFFLVDCMGTAFVVSSRPVQREVNLNSWDLDPISESHKWLIQILKEIEAICEEHEDGWGMVFGEVKVSR